MDDTLQAAREALRQRFQSLGTQLRQIHAQWQEAVRAGDRARQSALIVREGELLADVQEMITAYQTLIANRHG
jgi:hypothetical protein